MDAETAQIIDNYVTEAMARLDRTAGRMITSVEREIQEAREAIEALAEAIKRSPGNIADLIAMCKGRIKMVKASHRNLCGSFSDSCRGFRLQTDRGASMLYSDNEGLEIKPGESVLVILAFIPIEE